MGDAGSIWIVVFNVARLRGDIVAWTDLKLIQNVWGSVRADPYRE